jgi:hypothetical protein
LLEQNDEWTVQRARYVTLETMAALSDRPGSRWSPYGQRKQLRYGPGTRSPDPLLRWFELLRFAIRIASLPQRLVDKCHWRAFAG